MKKVMLGGVLALVAAVLVATGAFAHGNHKNGGFKAFLSSYSEVPANSTTGVGKFKAKVNGDTIEYKLSYQDLEGGAVHFAHIHLGQRGANGGVAAFLCGGSKPACPGSGEVTGTITASDVVGPADQGIAAGEFDELVNAMKAGVTYVNIHTDQFPNGEIRGQIGGKRGGFGGFESGKHKNHGSHKGGHGHDH